MYIKEINIKNRVYNCHFDNLIKARKLETKKILNDEENYKVLMMYFTRYVQIMSIKIFILC